MARGLCVRYKPIISSACSFRYLLADASFQSNPARNVINFGDVVLGSPAISGPVLVSNLSPNYTLEFAMVSRVGSSALSFLDLLRSACLTQAAGRDCQHR
jgi:hypothetical protein